MIVPYDTTDHAEIAAIQERLQAASDKLAGLVSRVAVARQVRDYDGDRRKRALAVAMTPYLSAGESAAAAEAKGRASYQYEQSMLGLANDLQSAELAIAEYDTAKVAWESARSLLAVARDLSRM